MRLILISMMILSGLMKSGPVTAAEAPDPETERQTFEVADGFEIKLYAADPQLAKPTNMNFDPQGRLWVASSETYPQVKPGEIPNDKIIVLEDTKGAGFADKATVFADHLFLPTGVIPGDGGVYVANSTELLHLKDSTGSGKADLKRVVLSGFGTEDTHHILHTFRWGMDGRLYMNQSIYIHSHIETPYGVKRLNAGGTWRFDPRTLQLEVFTRGLVNHWGHCFTQWGESLGTDGAGGEGVNFFFNGATFTAAKEADGSNPTLILHGMTPGSPKYAGAEIISGRHFPADWQGDVITSDFRASRIVRFKLTEEGSGFTAKLMPDVVHLKNVKGSGNGPERAFRPIDAKMGPDGALYIADWFNPIIQHGEVDFRDPRRDHTHGRIWRITAKNSPLVERPQLAGASVEQLLKLLEAPEEYTRAQARRVLTEKGAPEVLAKLDTWIANPAATPLSKLEGLWMHQALNAPDAALLKTLLSHAEPHVRAAATRVLRDWHATLPDALDVLGRLIEDPSPRVRLEAITTLENIPNPKSLEIALRALNKPRDANIDFALHHAARSLKEQWLPGVENGSYSFGGNAAAMSFALQAVGSKSGTATLLNLIVANKIAPENRDNVLALITVLGGAAETAQLYALQESSTEPGLRLQIFKALENAARERRPHPHGDLSGIVKYFNHADIETAAAAIRLAGVWKAEKLRDKIEAPLHDPAASDALKIASLDALASLGGPKSIASLSSAAGAKASLPVRTRAVANLVSLDPKAALEPATALLSQPLDANSAAELFSAFAREQGAGATLAAALDKSHPNAGNGGAGLRYFNASGQNEPELIKLLKTLAQDTIVVAEGTQPSPTLPGKTPMELVATMTAADMPPLIAQVMQSADARRGEQIFRRRTLSCFSCHAIGGAGGQVGPDLSNVGAASPIDYLIDSVLFPNKSVKEGFNAITVWTKDDEVTTGIIVRQSATHLILRDGTRDEILIPLSEIATKKESGSLMPNGLADSLTRGEFADLIRFLSELGKPGPFSTAQSLAVRRFRILDTVPNELAAAKAADIPRLLNTLPNLLWLPAYADVSGMLTAREFSPGRNKGLSFARFELECSTPGPIGLHFNLTTGLSAWLDGVPFDPAAPKLELTRGRRVITLAIDSQARNGTDVKIEPEELPGSAARFTRVGGK